MKRWDYINAVIAAFNYESYLEIGWGTGENYNNIYCTNKEAVDIESKHPSVITSSSFDFLVNCQQIGKKFDCIFIDGDHRLDPCLQDFNLALECLNPGGAILLHDINPPDEYHTRPYEDFLRSRGPWTGDCWRAWMRIRGANPDKYTFAFHEDYGVGVYLDVDRAEPAPFTYKEEYEWFRINRGSAIGVILFSNWAMHTDILKPLVNARAIKSIATPEPPAETLLEAPDEDSKPRIKRTKKIEAGDELSSLIESLKNE